MIIQNIVVNRKYVLIILAITVYIFVVSLVHNHLSDTLENMNYQEESYRTYSNINYIRGGESCISNETEMKKLLVLEWEQQIGELLSANQTIDCKSIVWKPIETFPFREMLKPLNLTPYLTPDKSQWNPNGLQTLLSDYKMEGFFMYSIASGMSNQIWAFYAHVFRAMLLSRILVVSPLTNSKEHSYSCTWDECIRFKPSKHNPKYNRFVYSACTKAAMHYSHFFSIVKPNNGTHYVTNPFYYVYASDYVKLFNSEIDKVTEMAQVNNLGSTYLQLTGIGGWRYELYDVSTAVIWNNNTLNYVHNALHQILNSKGDSKFIGVHLRRGDYAQHCKNINKHGYWKSRWTLDKCYPSYDRIFEQVDNLKRTHNISNVIVVTDEKNKHNLQLMEKKGWILASNTWRTKEKFNKEECPGITLPILDQCMMTIADEFIGNLMSSFSMHIRMLRKLEGKSSLSFT